MHEVVVSAVRKAVSAATIIFTAISIRRFFVMVQFVSLFSGRLFVAVAARTGARAFALSVATLASVGVRIGVFHLAIIGAGYALHLLAVAVDAGNLDGRVLQFVFQVDGGREDDAASLITLSCAKLVYSSGCIT